jgi:predicted nucleic acid-binding protein
MIFLDTNFLVRLLVDPQSEDDRRMTDSSARLMRSVMYDTKAVTTSDAVIAEVVFVLSGSVYGATRRDIAAGLSRLIQLPGFVAPQKAVWLGALQMWLERPSLSFVDTLAASYSLSEGHELATFDRRLASYPGLSIYSPETR